MKNMRGGFGFLLIAALLAPVPAACDRGDSAGTTPLAPLGKSKRVERLEIPPHGVVVVRPGDTIDIVANRYGVPPQRIIAGNNLKPPYDISGLNALALPKPRGHVVRRGDTLTAIARRYGVSVQELVEINGLDFPDQLQVGQQIVIPREIDFAAIDAILGIEAITPSPAAARTDSDSQTRTAAAPAPAPAPAPQSERVGSSLGIAAPPPESSLTATTPPPAEESAPPPAKRIAAAAPLRAPAPPSRRGTSGGDAVRFSPAGEDYTWPVNGTLIARYGSAGRGIKNDGVDIAAPAGTPVLASAAGQVGFVGRGLKSFGNLVLIKHGSGWVTAYAHMGEVHVEEGQNVTRGMQIGVVGQSGNVDTPQLHFELREGRRSVNPEEYLS